MLDYPIVRVRHFDRRNRSGQSLDMPEEKKNHTPYRQQRDRSHITFATPSEVIAYQPVGVDDQRASRLDKSIVDMKNTVQKIVPHTLPSQTSHRRLLPAMVAKVSFKFGSTVFANHLSLVIKNRETKIHRPTLPANKPSSEFQK